MGGEPHVETGIPCFRCAERSGLEYPVRKPEEATLCAKCFKEHMAEEAERQARHQTGFLEGVKSDGGSEKARELWGLFGDEEREGISKILGDAAIRRILSYPRRESLSGTGPRWEDEI